MPRRPWTTMVHMAANKISRFCTQESLHLAQYRIGSATLGSLHRNGIRNVPRDHRDGAFKGAVIEGKDVWQHKYNVGNVFRHSFMPILRPRGFAEGFASLVHSRGLVSKAGLIAMATVTKRNFAESFELMKSQLETADFVALDLEMTGVDSTLWRKNLELDSCETRYQNLKHSAEKFAVWQCGVCPFKWDQENNKFLAYPYNFFVFPRNELQLEMPSRGFYAQTTSLEFLAKHRFDFNACVYDGISYLSHDQETSARKLLGLAPGSKKQSFSEDTDIPLTKSGHVIFTERIRVQIGKWRDGLLCNRQKWQYSEKLAIPIGQFTTEQDPVIEGIITSVRPSLGSLRPTMALDVMSSQQTRLVKQVIKKHYPDLVAIVKEKNPLMDRHQVSLIYTSSAEDKAQLVQELADEEQQALEARVSNAVGFRKVIDAIVGAGVPVIGHNCILDMTHIHSKFFGSLPSSIGSFSSSLLQQFPCIVDTKYLLRAEPTLRGVLANRSTSLAIVFSHICQGFADRAVATGRFYFGKGKILNNAFSKVAVEVAEGFQRYGAGKDTGLKHEAGFDAYMTGAVFAQACHLLQIDAGTIRNLPKAVKAGEQGLASYANMLAMGWVGNMALDLATGRDAAGVKALQGPHSSANRQHEHSTVALVWGFPLGSKENEIRTMVQKVFNPERQYPRMDVVPVDESSAFVDFKNPHLVHQFLELMLQSMNSRAGEKGSQRLRAAPYEAYEYLCKTPLTSERLADSASILQLDHLFSKESFLNSHASQLGRSSKVEEHIDLDRVTEQGSAELHFPEPSDWDVGYQAGEATLKEELEIASAGEQNSVEQVVFTDSYRSGEVSPPTTTGFNNWMKRSVDDEELACGPSLAKQARTQGPTDS